MVLAFIRVACRLRCGGQHQRGRAAFARATPHPDEKRGRVSAVNSLFIGTSNELGGAESGFVAQLFGRTMGNPVSTGAVISVVSGGIGTILVVVAVALIGRKSGNMAAWTELDRPCST